MIVGAASLAFSFLLNSFLKIPAGYAHEAENIFILLSVSFAVSLISNSLSIILSVYNLDVHTYLTKSFLLIAQVMLSFYLVSAGHGISGLAMSTLLSEIAFLLYLFYLIRKLKLAELKIALYDQKLLTDSLAIGKWFLAGFLAQLLLKHTDLFLIGRLDSMRHVTEFIFSSKLYWVAFALFQTSIKIINPQLIQWIQGDANKNLYGHLINSFINLSIGVITLTGTGIYLFNPEFLHWWLDDSFFLGNFVNLMLMLTFIFSSVNLTIKTLQTARLEWKQQKISSITEGFLHVFLSVLLGIIWGVKGIIAGITLASLAGVVISAVQYSIQTSGNSLSEIRSFKPLSMFLLVVTGSILLNNLFPSLPNATLFFLLNGVAFIFLFMKELRIIAIKMVKN